MSEKNNNKIKTDCRFYDKEKRQCKALNNVYCAIEEKPCRFYKQKALADTKED